MTKKILVVDDSKSIRQMVSMTLTTKGFEVVEAEDGEIALNKAKSDKFDLIITDVNMPNMDGIQFISELKKEANYKFVPALFLTTESSGDMKERGKAVGATGWIVKPFAPEKLISVLDRVL